MKVVIELDSADYMYIKNGCIVPIKIDNHIYDAIRSGTVLPKGHGALIDKDQFEQLLRKYGLDHEADTFIPMATTVIEADKGNK